MQWLVTEVMHINKNEFLATKLQSGITIRSVIDVSYHPTYQYITSTWIIQTYKNNRTITGANFVPGDAKSQCSHRSKLCGLISDIRNINNICSKYNLLEGVSGIGCDGLEAYKF